MTKITKLFLGTLLLTNIHAASSSSDEETTSSSSSFFSRFFSASSKVSEDSSASCLRASKVNKAVQAGMTPLDGAPFWGHEPWGEDITIPCLDGVKLSGKWLGTTREGPTIVLCHGNGMTADNYYRWARWFQKECGLNVLAYTIHGYPGSEGSSEKIAITSALGIEGALRYAIDQKGILQANLMLYGFSLGGIPATYGARYFNIPAIYQNTLTRVGDIVENTTCISLPECSRKAIGRSHIDNHEGMPDLDDVGLFGFLGQVPLNSCDNLDNISNSHAPAMILYAQGDRLMGGEDRARELYTAARLKDPKRDVVLHGIPGGDHVTVFLDNAEAQEAVKTFIARQFKH